MRRWMVMALIAGMVTLSANAQETGSKMQMNSMGTKCGGMGMQRKGMQQGGMMGDCNMMGSGMGMMGDCNMMGPGMGMMGMMDDPEIQQMMMDEMIDHRKKMMRERMEFQKSMQKKMMSNPKVIKTMLSNILENPEAVKKTLNDNPDLKAKFKKVL